MSGRNAEKKDIIFTPHWQIKILKDLYWSYKVCKCLALNAPTICGKQVFVIQSVSLWWQGKIGIIFFLVQNRYLTLAWWGAGLGILDQGWENRVRYLSCHLYFHSFLSTQKTRLRRLVSYFCFKRIIFGAKFYSGPEEIVLYGP